MPPTFENFSATQESAQAHALSLYATNLFRTSASDGRPPDALPSTLNFKPDIYHPSAQTQSIEKTLVNTPADKIQFTTPGQDHADKTQPNYYLNAKGQLVLNHKPAKGGPVTIEVEGNNSARKAEQYANQMQKDAIKDLVAMYKHAHPGEKIPEMWQSILNATPDPDYANSGDSANNNTETKAEENAYDNSQAYDSSPPPENSTPTDDTYSPSSYDDNGGTSSGGDPGGAAEGGTGGASTTSNLPNEATSDGGASTANLQQSSGTVANYNSATNDLSQNQSDIYKLADQDAGLDGGTQKSMWGGWAADGATGEEGCAASVSQILDDAHAANLHNAQDDNVNGLQADLLKQGWTITSTPQPGDVWIGRGGTSSGHTGIVGDDGKLLDNHSSTGLFSSDSLSYANDWTTSVFLKPPAKGT